LGIIALIALFPFQKNAKKEFLNKEHSKNKANVMNYEHIWYSSEPKPFCFEFIHSNFLGLVLCAFLKKGPSLARFTNFWAKEEKGLSKSEFYQQLQVKNCYDFITKLFFQNKQI